MSEQDIRDGGAARTASLVDSYRRLADLFRDLLSEQSVDVLLEHTADALSELIPYDSLTIYEADEVKGVLHPVVARDQWAEEVLNSLVVIGEGITGWVAESREPFLSNEVHLHPRAQQVPGTPLEPEALVCVPLIARGSLKGALNIYRNGVGTRFEDEEFELAQRFADAAALALDNAHIRAALEHQAQTDALTGLYNHRFFHERLRAELTRASRAHDSVGLIVFDLDDFKRVNDIHGHATGDYILTVIADIVRNTVRGSDVACRIGGEEFGVILPSCDAGDALGLARRITETLAGCNFDPAGKMTISVGIAQGPEHAMNPRELVACAEAAMMTAKSKGKDAIVLFDDAEDVDRSSMRRGEVRSIAHLKMLQSLAGKLNRLNDVRQIGSTIATELRTLIDYHNCRVYTVEDNVCVPIAYRGEVASDDSMLSMATCHVGEGITGRAAETGRSVLVDNALTCDFAVQIRGTDEIEESILAAPLVYGVRVIGVVVISKLGIAQFDEDDVRLLEVLTGHASVAMENARLYESQRREAEHARALLEFADAANRVHAFHAICDETVQMANRLLDSRQASLWLQDERSAEFRCNAHEGYDGARGVDAAIRLRVDGEAGERLLEGRREPFLLSPEEADEAFGLLPGTVPARLALAPIFAGEGARGWITVRQPSDKHDGFFTEERLRFFASLASHASAALQKALLYKGYKENAEIASALLQFSEDLSEAEGLEHVLGRSAELTARIMGAPKTSLWLQDLDTSDMVCEATWGVTPGEQQMLEKVRFSREVSAPFHSAPGPIVLTRGMVAHIEGIEDLNRNFPVALAPLRLDGGRLACIIATAPALGDYEFSDRKMRLLAGIANQVGMALNNALSFQNLEKTFLDTVEALANALEAKDKYTSTHARWITDAALLVGTELGMDRDSLKRLELGALFHDIGKIGIPLAILQKPGPLEDDEWEVIRTHPELGEKILAPIGRLADVRPIVRHCHEHFDGSGYPDRRAGGEIPLESRIILVVDAFHAMTSDRPYRKALPLDEACGRLERAAGTQFDPQIVRIFLRLVRGRPELASGPLVHEAPESFEADVPSGDHDSHAPPRDVDFLA